MKLHTLWRSNLKQHPYPLTSFSRSGVVEKVGVDFREGGRGRMICSVKWIHPELLLGTAVGYARQMSVSVPYVQEGKQRAPSTPSHITHLLTKCALIRRGRETEWSYICFGTFSGPRMSWKIQEKHLKIPQRVSAYIYVCTVMSVRDHSCFISIQKATEFKFFLFSTELHRTKVQSQHWLHFLLLRNQSVHETFLDISGVQLECCSGDTLLSNGFSNSCTSFLNGRMDSNIWRLFQIWSESCFSFSFSCFSKMRALSALYLRVTVSEVCRIPIFFYFFYESYFNYTFVHFFD